VFVGVCVLWVCLECGEWSVYGCVVCVCE